MAELINLEYELEKYNLSCIHRIMCKWDCTALKCPYHESRPYNPAAEREKFPEVVRDLEEAGKKYPCVRIRVNGKLMSETPDEHE